ncbi:FAD binding domain-containing protein [Scytonema sp. PRP1]|uniref:FAD binding domain-containing protein n=1 Tax=Scytonema sp. PRP1 TaxID=3120513 RepID=UPI002FD1A924
MNPFTYVRAANSDEAIATLKREPQAMLIAGGTNMLDLMKEGVHTPTQLVDIRKLPSTEIVTKDGGIRMGAAARNSDVAYNSLVQERYPVLSKAILAGASAQLRNMATVGGNLNCIEQPNRQFQPKTDEFSSKTSHPEEKLTQRFYSEIICQ